MQTRYNMTNLFSQVSMPVQAHFVLLVIFGCILLLVALAIPFQLHLVQHILTLPFATHLFVEGPPDSLTSLI